MTKTSQGRLEGAHTIAQALRRPEVAYADVADALPMPVEIGERVAIEIKLAGYIARQRDAIERAQRAERDPVPPDFAFASIGALSLEAREKFASHRPRSLGAAARIPGISPADVAILGLAVHRARVAAPA